MNKFFSKNSRKTNTELQTTNPLFSNSNSRLSRPRTMTSVNSDPEPYLFIETPQWKSLKEEIIHGLKKNVSFGRFKKNLKKNLKNQKIKKIKKTSKRTSKRISKRTSKRTSKIKNQKKRLNKLLN